MNLLSQAEEVFISQIEIKLDPNKEGRVSQHRFIEFGLEDPNFLKVILFY
jgi:hypothetical protein